MDVSTEESNLETAETRSETRLVMNGTGPRAEVVDAAEISPIGFIPKEGSLNLEGLDDLDVEAIFSTPKQFWLDEVKELRSYFNDQVGESCPQEILNQLDALEIRSTSIE